MSSRTRPSKKGENEKLTELTDKFYRGEEEPESAGHTARQSDSQAIYVSSVQRIRYDPCICSRFDLTKGIISRRRCRGDTSLVMS